MIDTREKLLIDKIRSLCSQLEEEANRRECLGNDEKTNEELDKLQALIEMSCDNYWVYDVNTNMVEFQYVKGLDSSRLPVHKSYTAILQSIPVEHQKSVSNAFMQMMHGECDEKMVEFQTHIQGSVYVVRAICKVMETVPNMKILGVTHICHKVSAKEIQTVQEEEKFNVLMSLSNMLIWEYDVKEDTFFANESLFTKLKLEERVYQFDEVVDILDMKDLHEFKQHVINNQLNGYGVVHIKPKNHPMDFIFETNFKPIIDKYGRCQMVIGTMEDITEKEILKTNASKDPLTNSYNRRTADMTLNSSFEKFKNGEDFFTLIFFDIDNFKRINDSYGHDMGDYVLRHVCEIIGKEIRSSDMLCRWGGDEFLLVCTGIQKENIYAYIDRLRKLIEATEFAFNKEKVHVTVSMGAAYYYHSDSSFEQAMKRADRSVYKSKLAGRNKVCILK